MACDRDWMSIAIPQARDGSDALPRSIKIARRACAAGNQIINVRGGHMSSTRNAVATIFRAHHGKRGSVRQRLSRSMLWHTVSTPRHLPSHLMRSCPLPCHALWFTVPMFVCRLAPWSSIRFQSTLTSEDGWICPGWEVKQNPRRSLFQTHKLVA